MGWWCFKNKASDVVGLRIVPAVLVFIGSYFPLAIILALQDIKDEFWKKSICLELKNCAIPEFKNPTHSLLVILLTGVCLFFTLYVLNRVKYKYPVKVVEFKSIPSEIIGYSFPYIVSFMGVDYSSPDKVAGLLIFLTWMFIIAYKSGQIIMNPILLIFGWCLYEAKIKIGSHDRVVRILSRKRIVPSMILTNQIQENFITNGEVCDE